ncbi:MAG: AMP-binding protein [Austwickia sp.]|nr:AMP-binding protein [Austwickia sp.]
MVLRGPLPDVDIPEMSLYQRLIEPITGEHRDKLALINPMTGQELTFGQVRDEVEHVAAWFATKGVGPGDSVGLALPTCPEYVTAFHGIARAGAAASPMNVMYAPREFAEQLEMTRSKFVIVHVAMLAAMVKAATQAGLPLQNLIVVGDIPAGAVPEPMPFTPYSALTTCAEPLPPENVTDPRTHVAALPLSSGIGGDMKPVMLTHYNLVAEMTMLYGSMDAIKTHHTLVSFLPFSHVYALSGSMNFALSEFSLNVTLPLFDPAAYLAAVQKYRATLLFLVPSVASLLASNPMVDDYDLSSVKCIIVGAAPLSEEMGNAMAKRLNTIVLQGYGMTECCPVTHVMLPEMENVSCETVGPGLSNLHYRVVDVATAQDVTVPEEGESEPGELWVRGPNIMLGYLDRPEETAEIIDTDGFLHTGDLVRVDHRGVVRIVGRTKELIKNSGFQVAPAELEAVLKTHPAVQDAGVFGVPMNDGTGNESPYALIQLKEGQKATPIDIIKHLNPQVAKYKFLRSVTFVDAIPRDDKGAIIRAELPGLAPAKA